MLYAYVFTFAPCETKMMGDFHAFEMVAHTMTQEGFCRLKTLLVEPGMSAEDFARTLLFCRLQIASTVNNFLSEKRSRSCPYLACEQFFVKENDLARVRTCLVNNFSSEKMISLVSVGLPAFNLLRKIFAQASLFSFWRSVRC